MAQNNYGIIPSEFDTATITAIQDVDGNPWWVAKEVCDVLGYVNGRKAVADHCKHAKKMTVTNRDGQRGGAQFQTIIPESDLYRLIIKSTLPAAEQFERWVMEEVLPTIRKTGAYEAPMRALNDPAAMRALLLTYSEKVLELQPKADGFDRIANAEYGGWRKRFATCWGWWT